MNTINNVDVAKKKNENKDKESTRMASQSVVATKAKGAALSYTTKIFLLSAFLFEIITVR